MNKLVRAPAIGLGLLILSLPAQAETVIPEELAPYVDVLTGRSWVHVGATFDDSITPESVAAALAACAEPSEAELSDSGWRGGATPPAPPEAATHGDLAFFTVDGTLYATYPLLSSRIVLGFNEISDAQNQGQPWLQASGGSESQDEIVSYFLLGNFGDQGPAETIGLVVDGDRKVPTGIYASCPISE